MSYSELLPWERDQVVKLFRPGYPKEAVETELKKAQSARALGIPTPTAERIIEIEGRRGIVFERCEGPTLLEIIVTRAAPVQRLAQVFFDFQRSIHRCPGAGLPDQKNALARKILQARGASETLKRQALEALARLPDGESTCHGDFHPANVIMSAKGPVAVDWLDAGRGDATLDAARTLLLLQHAAPGKVAREIREAFSAAYADCLADYLNLAWAGGLELIERWKLPITVARLGESWDESECQILLDHISTMPAASRS